MANRAWRAPPPAGTDAARADDLSARFQLPAPLGRALFLRGLQDEPAWRQFLAAEMAEFPEPPAPLNLRDAARHLAGVCRAGGHALVHGDYDVDGICGTALLTRTLTLWGAKVTPFLPSRFAEGYGIAEAAIEKIKRERIATLVTADCGTNHGALLDAAAQTGCTVIVCDHHLLVEGQQPKSALLINPHQPGDPSGLTGHCGSAIAMELLLAIAAELGKAAPRESLSRLAAIASITDVMPLTGRTRTLVAAGLKALPSAKAPGLRALIRQCRLAAPMRAEDAGFAIGPRLNAAGRMGHPDDALALLLAADDRAAGAAMARLEARNTERREVSGRVFTLALKEAETQGDRPVIAVGNENWHIGVMGIVAQRLRETTGKPALAVAFDADGLGTGSGRSAGGLHLEQLLGRQRDKLVRSGGHAAACGLTVKRAQWEAFRTAMWDDATTLERTPDALPQADATLGANELTDELLQAIHALEPWGEGMPAPRFEAAVALSGVRRFGRDEGKPHAELTIKGLPRPLVFWRGADEMANRKGTVKLLLRPGRDSFVVEAVDFS